MKKLIFGGLLFSMLFGNEKFWDSHSAHILPKKRWEIGIFQPFRYGYSENLEYSIYPLWSIVMPNISLKKKHDSSNGYLTASRWRFIYPTPLLNAVARKGIGGLIDPSFIMPPMLGISGSWMMSQYHHKTDITINFGLDLAINFGKLDQRSSIDLPLIYHRLGVFYNGWGIHSGLDMQKQLISVIKLLVDIDLKILPGIDSRSVKTNLSKILGNYAIEHKMLFIYQKSDSFRILTGYKLVHGQYPFGIETRLLPFLPLLEKWVPMIELQWANSGK